MCQSMDVINRRFEQCMDVIKRVRQNVVYGCDQTRQNMGVIKSDRVWM